jgi:hydrogenase expression/formation protein HypC
MCLGIPGEIVATRVEDGIRIARVRFGGALRDVCLEAQPDAGLGDWVLVHVGMAIARIDPAVAEDMWRILGELGEVDGDGEGEGASP